MPALLLALLMSGIPSVVAAEAEASATGEAASDPAPDPGLLPSDHAPNLGTPPVLPLSGPGGAFPTTGAPGPAPSPSSLPPSAAPSTLPSLEGPAATPPGLDAPPTGTGATSDAAAGDPEPPAPPAVSEDWWSEARQSIEESEYEISWQPAAVLGGTEGAWQAPNRAQDFRIYFTGAGVRIMPRGERNPPWELGLSLLGYGRGSDVRPLELASLTPAGNRIDYARPALGEWYVNDPAGLKQGFTLPGPPETLARPESPPLFHTPGARRGMTEGDEAHPAFLVVELSGNLTARLSADGRAVDFAPASGGFSVVRYADLRVHDATGRELPAWMEGFHEAGTRGVRLVWDDRDAAYPVTVDPLATSASWTYEGDVDYARLGFSVAGAGDVNGDGYDDVIVGAYSYDVDGDGTFDGRAFVFHGGPSGLATTPSWTAEPDLPTARLGRSVSTAGDVNGRECVGGTEEGTYCLNDLDCDGGGTCHRFDDVIVGAPGYDGDRGRIYVYHGGPGGLGATAAWQAEGGTSGDNFGFSVASAGDVNGDFLDDVIVGAPFDDPGIDGSNEGGAFVYHGSAGIGLFVDGNEDDTADCGVDGTPCTPSDAHWHQDGDQAEANFGRSVAGAGDVNGDGIGDVIVGAPYYDNPLADEGRVYVFHGSSPWGLSAEADWDRSGGLDNSIFGHAVGSAGDVNGDGTGDVIIGAPWFQSQSDVRAGRAYVYHGSPEGLPADPDWFAEGDRYDARLGYSVGAAGDVDGDGLGDVVVGADGFSDGATTEGAAFLYYGRSISGLGDSWAWEFQGNQYRARAGRSVAGAGDVNHDGFDDVIVGSDGYYRGQTTEGRALVFHGAAGITPGGLEHRLGLPPGTVDPRTKWWVESTGCGGTPPKCDNRTETPDAVAYGPLPGSILLTTGRASDGGLGDTDWLGDGDPDTAVFRLYLNVPSGERTLCFNAQFVTSESDAQTDEASFLFDYVRSGGSGTSDSYALSELATTEKNPPATYCIETDPDGATKIDLEFRVADGDADGDHDSGLLISRVQFRGSPMPLDVDVDPHGCFHNPAPHDVSAAAGTYKYSKHLFEVPGVSLPFSFGVSYSSSATKDDVLSRGWGHSYISEARKTKDKDGGGHPDNIMVRPVGGTTYFQEIDEDDDGTADTPGVYGPKHGGEYGSLTLNSDADKTITYTTKNHQVSRFAWKVHDKRYLLTSIEDANGNQLTFDYDTDNRLEQVTDTRGHTFAFVYGGVDNERLHTVSYDWTDENGPHTSSVSFDYDTASGYLRSFTDLNGEVTTFTYTRDGRLLAATDADGMTFVGNTYEEYQGLGLDQDGERLVTQRDGRDPDPFDPAAGIAFDYEDEFLVMTDRLGRQQTTAHDVKGRRAWTVNATGVREEYTYDRNDNPVETRRQLPSEPAARTMQTARYDDTGNLLEQTRFPLVCVGGTNQDAACPYDDACPGSTCGVSGAMDYDLRHNLHTQADHYGNTTRLDHDANDNLLSQRDPLGNEIKHVYSRLGPGDAVIPSPTSTTDARGFTSTCEYDGRGYLTAATGPLGGTVQHTYNDLGHRTSTLDPEGYRLLAETGHDAGHRSCTDYDDDGRVVAETAYCGTCYGGATHGDECETHDDCDGGSCGLTVTMSYDAQGNLLSKVQPDGTTTTYEYTPTGQTARETDPLGHETRYEYDAGDRLVSVFVNNPGERTAGTTCPLVTAHVHDDGDRITEARVYVPDDQECSNEPAIPLAEASAVYDEIGNRTSLTDPNGNVTTYEYDLLRRLTRETDALGTVKFTYDGRDLITSRTTGEDDVILYDYDASGRMVEIDFPGDGITHQLDGNGNRVSSRRTTAAGPVTREYDALDRMVSRTDEFGYTVTYEYDPAGNPIRLVYPSGVAVEYEYDGLNRLIGVTDWDGRTATYGYDIAGNITSIGLPDGSTISYTYDAARRVTGIHDRRGGQTRFRATYTLNAAGKRIAADLELPLEPSLEAGRTLFTPGAVNALDSRSGAAGDSTYNHDADGNMLSGILGGASRTMVYNALNQLVQVDADTYRYDADNLRVETTRGTTVRRQVYDVTAPYARLLEERDGDGNVVARYLYGLGLIARDGPEGPRIYHYDSRGSTVALTDPYGTVTDRYAYDPYGLLVACAADVDRDGDGTVDPTENLFTYAGRDGVQDDGNGLYYMKARYYAPELKRFIQKDQIFDGSLSSPQSLNRYVYVEGDPILLTDPNGDFIFSLIVGIVVTAVITAAINVAVECADGDGCDVGDVFETLGSSFLEAIPVVGTIYQGISMGVSGQWDWASFGMSIASDALSIVGAGSAMKAGSKTINTALKAGNKAVKGFMKGGKGLLKGHKGLRGVLKGPFALRKGAKAFTKAMPKTFQHAARAEKWLGRAEYIYSNRDTIGAVLDWMSSNSIGPPPQSPPDSSGTASDSWTPAAAPQPGSAGKEESCGCKCEVWR